jgi:16S rRNA (uracil1498-N3)-methyltransferase
MRYLYHVDAGIESLTLQGDSHKYIFKVRRHKVEDEIALRNLEDEVLYSYTVLSIDKHHTLLQLKAKEHLEVGATKTLHIGWCMIEPKQIEKVLPTLNELGVAKITFIYCERSQKQFKVDTARLHKIVLNSSQQCGRSQLMAFETADSLETFLTHYPQAVMVNFSENRLSNTPKSDVFVIGCEGGFTPHEVALFEKQQRVGFSTPLILKSESAVCALASKLLV